MQIFCIFETIIALASKKTELDWLGLCYHRFWGSADWNWGLFYHSNCLDPWQVFSYIM